MANVARRDPKPQPNHRVYLEVLRGMGAEQRLRKALELSRITKQLLWDGICNRFPDKSEEERRKLYLRQLARYQNRNY